MINIQRLNQIFAKIVQIDSPTGYELEFRDYIVEYLKNHSLADEIKVDNFGNIYARKEGQQPGYFYSAHLDTVEPGRGIKAVIENDYWVSEGETILGADNKSTLAAILETLHILKDTKNHRTLELVLTLSEEVGNYGAINFDYKLLKSQRGFCFDSSNAVGTIITASTYYERFDIKLIGQAAHASRPEEAINVLQIFNKILNDQPLGRLDEFTLFNIGVMNGGSVRNTVPGEMQIKGEIRSFKEENLIKHKEVFIKIVKQIVNNYSAQVEIELVRENPGYYLDDQSAKKLIKQTADIIQSLKLPLDHQTSWGVSDANIFNDKGLVCINLGDGTEMSHSVDERIKVSELEKLASLMFKLLQV